MKAIFVTVRTGSTRLPNKSLLKINNKATIEYLIERVKLSNLADKIVLCTTTNPADNLLCNIAKNNNIHYFRGDEHNKWERWYGACKAFNVSFFVTADGDDLFYEAGLSDLCFTQYKAIGKNNILIDGQGLYNDVYGIDINALQIIRATKNIDNIEPHQIVNFIKNTDINIHKLKDVPELYKKRDIRMTLDYEDDLNFFTNIIEHFNGENVGLSRIISYIKKNPGVADINLYLEEKWALNQQTDIIK